MSMAEAKYFDEAVQCGEYRVMSQLGLRSSNLKVLGWSAMANVGER